MYIDNNWFEKISECESCGSKRKQIELKDAPFEYEVWGIKQGYLFIYYCSKCDEWSFNETLKRSSILKFNKALEAVKERDADFVCIDFYNEEIIVITSEINYKNEEELYVYRLDDIRFDQFLVEEAIKEIHLIEYKEFICIERHVLDHIFGKRFEGAVRIIDKNYVL